MHDSNAFFWEKLRHAFFKLRREINLWNQYQGLSIVALQHLFNPVQVNGGFSGARLALQYDGAIGLS